MQLFTKQLNKIHPLFDIAANLTDGQFGAHGHMEDRDEVVKRAG